MDSLDFNWVRTNLNSLYRPTFIESDQNGCVYVFDYAEFAVAKYCDEETTKFTIPKGKGPGELVNPVDMVLQDSLIIFTDPPNGKVLFYDVQGNYKKEWKFEQFSPGRLTIRPDGKFCILTQLPQPETTIYLVDSHGSVSKKFGFLPNPSVLHPAYNESNLVVLPAGKENVALYVSVRLGVLMAYKNGSLLMSKMTIDGQQNPQIIQKKAGNGRGFTRLDPEALYTAYKAAVNNQFVMLEYYNPVSKISFLDFYETDSLNYVISLPTPATFADITLTSQEIIGLAPDAIYRTTLPKRSLSEHRKW